MIETLARPEAVSGAERSVSERLSVLARDFQARMLNYSPSGCLLETNAPLEIGTVGTLQFVIDGKEFADDVLVVRCQSIEGAGSLYQVGAKFLWTTATIGGSGRDSLRLALGIPARERTMRLVGSAHSTSS